MGNLLASFSEFIELSPRSHVLNNPANIFLHLCVSVITLKNQKGGFR